MDARFVLSLEDPAPLYRAPVQARAAVPVGRMADAIRALAIDATGPSDAGHADLPARMADVATTLWTRFHKFDAADPRWPDRDRFILSAGGGSLLLYALICLTGHQGMSIDDIRNFRQLHSPAAGHPEFGEHPAIEATTGPMGQGFATAVGLAIAERNMAARFGKSLVDHRTWVIASEADLIEGVGHEAAALAGHLCLAKLAVLYDDASGAGPSAAASDDVLKRFNAYGWATKRVDAHDPAQIAAALSFAVRSKKPTLIACCTTAGASVEVGADGAHAAGVNGSHAPAVNGYGVHPIEGLDTAVAPDDPEAPPAIPAEVAEWWHTAGSRGASARRSWLKRLARHNQRTEFERVLAGRLPDNWHQAVADLKQDLADTRPEVATGESSQKCLEALVPVTPELIGGSVEPNGANPLRARGMAAITAGNYGGRYVPYGVREHGMAAAASGLALHGGIIPFIGTRLAFTDYLRPALRICAMMRQRVIYVLTHDSIGLGEDGPTHQPVEHLASLRAMPNLLVFRPADTLETAECWDLAVRRLDGPSLLVLSQQAVPAWRSEAGENRCARGGYVLAEAEGPRQATLIATGSEVSIAMAAREKLAGDNIGAAVVSLPSWELFARQDAAYRAQVLGGAPRIGIEAAGGFGWEQWIGPDGAFIGMNGFGASARPQDLYTHFGITPEAVIAAVMRRLG